MKVITSILLSLLCSFVFIVWMRWFPWIITRKDLMTVNLYEHLNPLYSIIHMWYEVTVASRLHWHPFREDNCSTGIILNQLIKPQLSCKAVTFWLQEKGATVHSVPYLCSRSFPLLSSLRPFGPWQESYPTPLASHSGFRKSWLFSSDFCLREWV